MIRVEDLDVVVDLDIGSSHDTRTLLGQRQGCAVTGVHTDRHVLQVEQDFENVLLQAFERGVLVQYAVDLNFRDGEARDGRQ